MGRDIKVSEVDLGEKANVTITLKDLDESYYDPYRKTVSKFTLFMICKEQQEELDIMRAENERLRGAFTKPDREVLRAVCYGTVCYADEFAEILESYWEALK